MSPPSKHGPNRLDRYRQIHETVMDRFRDQGFVLSDDLAFADVGGGVIRLEGTIHCEHDLYIVVTKALEILDGDGSSAFVQTFEYTYNAALRGVGNVFRYDSAHADHNQEHHVHRYDVLNGDMSGKVDLHGPDGWPTLGDVIEELRGWAADNSEALADLGR